jgi:hypothetical protein
MQRRQHGLVHGRDYRAVVFHLHGVGEGNQLVLDLGEIAARGVLELQFVPQ